MAERAAQEAAADERNRESQVRFRPHHPTVAASIPSRRLHSAQMTQQERCPHAPPPIHRSAAQGEPIGAHEAAADECPREWQVPCAEAQVPCRASGRFFASASGRFHMSGRCDMPRRRFRVECHCEWQVTFTQPVCLATRSTICLTIDSTFSTSAAACFLVFEYWFDHTTPQERVRMSGLRRRLVEDWFDHTAPHNRSGSAD